MPKRNAGRWSALVVMGWLGACAGGQTGDTVGDGVNGDVVELGPCEPVEETLGLDDPLPAGYTARELLERVADTTVPAFAWRSEDALFKLETDEAIDVVTPELADAELELRVRARYDGGDRIALYEPGCMWSDTVALPVTISVEASDGSVERDVRGILYSAPASPYGYHDARAFFYADDDQVPDHGYVDRERGCDEGPAELSFADDGTPQGRLCDDRGRALRFPAACGGIAQRPFDEQATEGLPTLSETLRELGESARYQLVWPDQSTSTLELTLTPTSDLACHFDTPYTVGWYAALELRIVWLDEGVAYTQPATLSAHGGLVDGDNPPLELESQALLNDEARALFAERLDEPDLILADTILVIRETLEGELERFFRFAGSRDVSEGENEVSARFALEPLDAQ